MDIDWNQRLPIGDKLFDLILDFIDENGLSGKEALAVIPVAAAEAEAAMFVEAASEAENPLPDEFSEEAAQTFREHFLVAYALLSQPRKFDA